MATYVQYKDPFGKKLRGDEFGNMASYRKHPHRGGDWHPKELSPIPAMCNAKVTQVFWSDVLGWVVEALAADGVYTEYCHIAPHTVVVKVGEAITIGQVIGKTGGGKKTPSGSASTGSHLHVGMSKQKNGHLAPYDKLLDPFKWIDGHTAPPAEVAAAPAATPAPAAPAASATPDAPSATPDVAVPAAAPAVPSDFHSEVLNIDLSKRPKIKPGDKNAYVAYVQAKFGQTPTGVYDNKLKKAVIDLQKKNKYVADGVFGNLTWAKVIEL